MRKTRTYFILSLLLAVATSFTFCRFQNNPDSLGVKRQLFSVGKEVQKLDSKAMMVYQDSKQNYWFASEKYGIYKYNGDKLQLFTTKDGLCSTRVLGVQEDSLGNLYFDTPDGVSQFNGEKFKTLKVVEDKTKSVWKSEPGDLWFRMGWSKNGPYRFDGKNLYHVPFPKCDAEKGFREEYPNASFDPYGIYSMYKDKAGVIWFGTSNMGLFSFDGEKILWMYERHLVDTPKGGNFCIRSIVQDQQGYFWVTNSRYKFKISTNSFQNGNDIRLNYETKDGIVEDWEDVLYLNSIVADRNGNVWMQNTNGLWKYDGKERIPFFITQGNNKMNPTSVFEDNEGTIWLGTEDNGIYKIDGSNVIKARF